MRTRMALFLVTKPIYHYEDVRGVKRIRRICQYGDIIYHKGNNIWYFWCDGHRHEHALCIEVRKDFAKFMERNEITL